MMLHRKIAVGAIEYSSIGAGFRAQDTMCKSAAIDILLARTICAGKYLVVFTGNVGSVETAYDIGLQEGSDAVIDSLIVASAHPGVFPAMSQSVVLPPEGVDALGIIETFSSVSVLVAADVAGKAANVTLFRLHLAMALGGKGLLLMAGGLADVTAAVDAAAAAVRQRGLLVSAIVIPKPAPSLLEEYL